MHLPLISWGQRKSSGWGELGYGRWGCVTFACLVLPLALFRVIPATDLPQHLAISSVLWRWLHADVAVQAHYGLSAAVRPYHLMYVLLAPAVGWWGPFVGARLVMGLLAGGLVLAVMAVFRRLRIPAVWLLYVNFIFYGPLFYWGFIATLVGLLPLVWAVWALVSYETQPAPWRMIVAGGCGLLAVAAHIIYLWPVGVWAAVAGWRARDGRTAASWSLLGGACAAAGIFIKLQAGDDGCSPWEIWPSHIDLQWSYLLGFLGPFDHSLGRFSHVAGLLLMALVAWRSGDKLHPWRCRLWLTGGAMICTFVLCPRGILHGIDQAFLLAFRFLCFSELLALFASPSLGQPVFSRRCVAATLCIIVLIFSGSQLYFWHQFNEAAKPVLAALADPGQRAGAQQAARFGKAWPPVLQHLGMYVLANGGTCHQEVFTGRHLPIFSRPRKAVCAPAMPPRACQ